MNWEALVVALSLLALFVSIVILETKPVHAFIAVSLLLLVMGVITPEEFLSGFSNQSVATIFLVLVFSQILKRSDFTQTLIRRILNPHLSYSGFVLRMGTISAFISGVVFNTPLVGFLMPHVVSWARNRGLSPSRVLIPFETLVIMGGTITLVGSSSNLLINAIAEAHGVKDIGVFNLFPIGGVVVAVGILYWILIGWRLLPSHRDVFRETLTHAREYVAEAVVRPYSPLVGQSVARARLRQLRGLFLAEIVRNGDVIKPVAPTEKLRAGDRLVFVGKPETIVELLEQHIGIELVHPESMPPFSEADIVELVIPYNSSLAKHTVREAQFRSRYDAVVIAVHRQGERLSGKVGDITLLPGDMLLVLTGGDFWKRVEGDTDVYVVNKVASLSYISGWKGLFVLLAFAGSLVLASLKIVPLFSALAVSLAAVVLFRIAPITDLRRKVDWNLLLVCALTVPIGMEVNKSGLADILLDYLSKPFKIFTPLAGIFVIYIFSNLLTELMLTIAAAPIAATVALRAATYFGDEMARPFVLAAIFGVALSLLVPHSYQVHMMVMGPGGYKARDFLRANLPLSITFALIVPLLIYALYAA